jgi:hypothetical protein
MKSIYVSVAVILGVLLYSDVALAHGSTPIESDENNNRIIVWCNSPSNGGMEQTMVKDAFARWNTSLTNARLTHLVRFVQKSQTTQPCELRPEVRVIEGYAWIEYLPGEDKIVWHPQGYNESTYKTRRQVVMHEIGHSVGFDHPPTPEFCYPPASVLTSWCEYYGAPIPLYPGAHDMDDVRFYWGPGGVLPQSYWWE